MKNLFVDQTLAVKKNLFVKLLLLPLVLFSIGVGNAWGDDETLTITISSCGSGSTSAYTVTPWTESTSSGASISGSCKIIKDTYDMRFKSSYIYNTAALPGAIKSINIVKYSGSNRSVTPYVHTSSLASSRSGATMLTAHGIAESPGYTWNLSSTQISADNRYFYLAMTTDNAYYISSITITYEGSGGSTKTLSSIDITTQPTTTKYLVGETFSKAGAVVTATYSDATTANVSASASWTPTTGLVAGSNTITASYTEGGVTKTATTTVTAYTVTVNKVDEDGTAIADAGVTASATGRTLTASTGSTKYVFKQWKFGTASGTSIASATSASTSLTGTPSAAVTVIAEFYKPVIVTWMVNGSEYTTTQVANGSKPEFPDNPSSCDGTSTTFVGWTPTPWSGKLDDVSAKTIYTSGSAMPDVSGPVTYHAVFAKGTATVTPVANTWTRITSTSQLTNGATVLLVQYNDDKAINTTLGATSCTAYSEITNSTANLRWTAVESGSKWKFKSSSNHYLSTESLADGTAIALDETYDEWTISADAGGYSNCFNLNNGNDLEYYSTFKVYTWSSKYKSAYPFYIYIQKTTESTTYDNYLTNCCTNLASINGSFKCAVYSLLKAY